MFYFWAALSGLAMAVQGSWNAVLGKAIGLLWAILLVQGTGLMTAGIILAVRHPRVPATWVAPWYVYLGGPVGLLIIYLVAAAIPRLGVAFTTTTIILGQLLTAAVIDHLGLFGLAKTPFPWWKLGGVALLALGARILLARV